MMILKKQISRFGEIHYPRRVTFFVLTLLLGVASPAYSSKGVTVTTSNGKQMTLTLQGLNDSRGYQYCELVFIYEGNVGADIYTTSPLAPCSLDWWGNLDLTALAQEFGAKMVVKNGPQWWSMDKVGVLVSGPVDVGGAEMAFAAHLPAGTMGIPKYTVFNPAKTQNLVWKAGSPTYRIVDADGYVYMLQGHKIPADKLSTLGEKFQRLPDGWSYQVNIPAEDLVMNLTSDKPIPSIQDEFDQIYIRIPE